VKATICRTQEAHVSQLGIDEEEGFYSILGRPSYHSLKKYNRGFPKPHHTYPSLTLCCSKGTDQ
jgi:hypothetical protein